MELARSADRLGPPDVPPIHHGGVAYSQAEDGRALGFDQAGGVLVARDGNTGERLWTLAVYENRVDMLREADAQWVFFKSMALDPDGRLRIVDERGKAFLVDLKQRSVAPAP